MNPSVATLGWAIGIAGLFYLNRDKSARTSKALWVPVIWFWILGSRAVSVWLGMAPALSADALIEGSPIDAFVLQVLIVSGLVIVCRRGRSSLLVLKDNATIVCYFLYCLLSVIWSDFPFVAMKREIKAAGDIVMALVVVTDPQPIAALRILFSRIGFVLVPASALLIRYYPDLSTSYDQWTGGRSNIGVTTSKNILGATTLVVALGALWQILRLLKTPSLPHRVRLLAAQCTLFGFAIWNLFTANSATSTSCFMLGAFLMVVTGLRRFRGRRLAAYAVVLTLILASGLIKVTGADEALFHVLGREPNLTGRVDIWPRLISIAPNALIGSGFESFWLGTRLREVWEAFPNLYVNEAHNGYLEVYLNLGVIGVMLMILFLGDAFRRSVTAFRIDPDSGSLILAYVVAAALYSYTEAGFRMLCYPWMFLLLLNFAATNISRTYPPRPRPIARDQGANSISVGQLFDACELRVGR